MTEKIDEFHLSFAGVPIDPNAADEIWRLKETLLDFANTMELLFEET